MATIPAERADILTKRSFGHVATLGPQGEPQSNPVWIDWDGRVLKISQTTTRQKYHNLKRDSRVAVSVHDPDNPYRYLELRGSVDEIEADRDNAFINKLAQKYIDNDVYPWSEPGEERVVISIRPDHTTMQ